MGAAPVRLWHVAAAVAAALCCCCTVLAVAYCGVLRSRGQRQLDRVKRDMQWAGVGNVCGGEEEMGESRALYRAAPSPAAPAVSPTCTSTKTTDPSTQETTTAQEAPPLAEHEIAH